MEISVQLLWSSFSPLSIHHLHLFWKCFLTLRARDLLEKLIWASFYKVIVSVMQTFSISNTSYSNHIYVGPLESQVMQRTHRVYKNVVGIKAVSSKILKHCICCIWIFFVSSVCIV